MDTYYVNEKLVVSDPDVMGGTPCFSGTRVPIQTFIDYLEGGNTMNEFLDDFPTVSRKQAVAFLEQAKQRMLSPSA
jgi:uncharacterized protein (DUF433 family)